MSRLPKLDRYVNAALKSWDCPGVALSIVKADEVVHQNVYGLRDVEQQLPLTENTRFAMASVTKSFAAMSVALLVDEGKLEWDKPVREYMPEFVLDDPYVTRHVTVRDMLSHRTGLPRHDFAAWRLDISRAEFVKRMRHLTFSASFRERFQYNNLMYYATAHLVEKIAGQRWEDFVHQRIFVPLGMQASNFVPEPPQPEQHTALGYRLDRDATGKVIGRTQMPFGRHTELSPGAAGALFSTLADLTQWLKVHVNDGRAGTVQLVSSDNLKQMHQPVTVIPSDGFHQALMGTPIQTYGMGWFVEPYHGFTIVQHGGNVEGHSLMIGFVPRANVGVVVLTNAAAMPLRDILLYTGIDRALGMPDRDWNTAFHAMFDPLFAAGEHGKQTAADERMPDAPPSHPLATFVGSYTAEGYPEFAVRQDGDALQACTVGSLDWTALRHYHYDVFEWHLSDFDEWIKIRFLGDDQGEIDSISIPIEPAVENIVFKRKPLELSGELVAQLVGEYDPPIDGIVFSVTANDGKVFIAATGNPAEEVKPYKVDDGAISLRSRRSRFEFVRDGGAVSQLIVKDQFMTLEAPRKK